jgi:hypothetical protein
MDFEQAQKIRREFPLLSTSQKRVKILELHTQWLRLNLHRIYDYWPFQDREGATEEIVKAFRERNRRTDEVNKAENRPPNKPWTDEEFYEEARKALDRCYEIMRAEHPRVLELYMANILGWMLSKGNMKIVLCNKSPQKRRGRKKTKHLTLIKGGWDGSYHDDLPWHAEDLLVKERQ